MGYIENNLMQGEAVIYKTNLTKFILVYPIALLFLIPIIIGLSGAKAELSVMYFTISIFVFIPMEIAYFLQYWTSEFAVTDHRVLIKVGFIRRKSLEILLAKVEGISVDQGIFGRIFDYGTIVVRGTGGTGEPFSKICAPFEFRKKVQEQISKKQR